MLAAVNIDLELVANQCNIVATKYHNDICNCGPSLISRTVSVDVKHHVYLQL